MNKITNKINKARNKINKITKETTLAEVMQKESAKSILAKHRVPCLTCPMAQFEIQDLKIGDVCKMYGIDLKKLLEDLNSPVK